MMRKTRIIVAILFCTILLGSNIWANELFTPLVDICNNPESFAGQLVTVKGNYYGWNKAPGYPPITRSDWVIADEYGNAVYCTGKLPQMFEPRSTNSLGQPLTVLATVRVKNLRPYLEVHDVKTLLTKTEEMVSVAQIIFDPVSAKGRCVRLLGVLAKGYGVNGERMYLLADPTGALKLGRLPKLYPKGTILHLRGMVSIDENGLPMLDEIEIIKAHLE